jgi:transcription elongation factor Elf1
MNFIPLEQSYKIHHINPKTYSGTLIYNPICIFCNHTQSTPLYSDKRDGGAFRQCLKCKKHFRATILNSPVTNFTLSTSHLKGTN